MAKKKFELMEEDFDLDDSISKKIASQAELAASASINAQDQPEDVRNRIIYVKDEDLVDDPNNEVYFGDITEESVSSLTELMKTNGFQGVILAYPTRNGKYMIESGHRRRVAGRLAGFTEFPVVPTEPPEAEWERNYRLLGSNLGNRLLVPSPMRDAVVAQGIFETHQERLRYMKEHGLPVTDEMKDVNELTARDMCMSSANVERLRAFGRLIPQLQKLAEEKHCGWADLSAASVLSAEEQTTLYSVMKEQLKKYGDDGLTRKWIQSVIKNMKEQKREREQQAPRHYRQISATNAVIKGVKLFNSVLSDETTFRKEEIPYVIGQLEKLQGDIGKKLAQLKVINKQ